MKELQMPASYGRIPEAEQMSDELAAYINSLGDAVCES